MLACDRMTSVGKRGVDHLAIWKQEGVSHIEENEFDRSVHNGSALNPSGFSVIKPSMRYRLDNYSSKAPMPGDQSFLSQLPSENRPEENTCPHPTKARGRSSEGFQVVRSALAY